MKELDEAKARFFKEIEIIDAFLLGVQSVSSSEASGYIANLRRNNLRWLGDNMYMYASALVKHEQEKANEAS